MHANRPSDACVRFKSLCCAEVIIKWKVLFVDINVARGHGKNDEPVTGPKTESHMELSINFCASLQGLHCGFDVPPLLCVPPLHSSTIDAMLVQSGNTLIVSIEMLHPSFAELYPTNSTCMRRLCMA